MQELNLPRANYEFAASTARPTLAEKIIIARVTCINPLYDYLKKRAFDSKLNEQLPVIEVKLRLGPGIMA